MKRNELFDIEVYDSRDGRRIGAIDPVAFRKAAGARDRMFLAEVVERFNKAKEQRGEPERVRIEFRPGLERVKV